MGARGADGLPTRRHSGPRAARAGGRRRPVEIMTDAPKPLTADELKLLESKAGVTGLSTVDVRRLLASNARLRQLVLDAAKLLEQSKLTNEEARRLFAHIEDEVER